MQFAAKKLTRSDLTFFECQFRRQNAGNQKSINLNANVFVDLIFPIARTVAAGQPKQFHLPLSIYGPGIRSEPQRVTRKVIAAGGSQKNWRLNGEFVTDPDFDPERYWNLAADDLAVFGFEGDEGLPTGILMIIISQSEVDDAPLHEQLSAILGGRSMATISLEEISPVVESSSPDHPIRELMEAERDEALEEAALGSADGINRLLRKPSLRRMTPEALANAKSRAAAIGREGELIVDVYLRKLVREGKLRQAVWVSETNAVNPWDFEITESNETLVRVEVKSTGGPFDRKLHISHAEILAAAHSEAPRTDLFRVFALTNDGALLQISRNIKPLAREISKKVQELGDGIMPDGYTISPAQFSHWTETMQLAFEDEESEV